MQTEHDLTPFSLFYCADGASYKPLYSSWLWMGKILFDPEITMVTSLLSAHLDASYPCNIFWHISICASLNYYLVLAYLGGGSHKKYWK